MILTIPITGTVTFYNPKTGEVHGDPNDPVRKPDNLDLGNVSWVMVGIDVDKGTMDIEIAPAEEVAIPSLDASGKQIVDANGNPVGVVRATTDAEKQGYLAFAAQVIANIKPSDVKPLVKRLLPL